MFAAYKPSRPRGSVDLRWALIIALEEGLLAIVEDAKKRHIEVEGYKRRPLMRFEMVSGPRRLREYEKQIEAVEESLAGVE